jgi:hypothetical protein
MVCFGKLSNAREWEEANRTRFPFQLVLDPEMKLYRELGLKRSVSKVWTVHVLIKFAEKDLAGTLVVDHFEDDDVHPLGSDYISDSSGKLLLAFNGASSDARPSMDEIKGVLDAALS